MRNGPKAGKLDQLWEVGSVAVGNRIFVDEYFTTGVGEREAGELRKEALALLNSNILALQYSFQDLTVDVRDFPAPDSAAEQPDTHGFSVVIGALAKQILLTSRDARMAESVAYTIRALFTAHILSLNHVAKVRQAKREWEVSADLLSDEIYMLDMRMNIDRINRTAARRLGGSPRALVGSAFPQELLGVGVNVQAVLPTTPEDHRDFTSQHGGEYYRHRIFCIKWGIDRTGFVLIRANCTADVETQKRQLRSARLAGLGQVAMGLAHELNNPLSVILAAAGSLQRKQGADAQLIRFADIITSEIERCRRITHSLLDYGRAPGAGTSIVSLTEALRGLPARMAATHPRRKVQLELPAHAWVTGQEDDLLRLFSNLVANALEASANTPVTIGVQALENAWRVSVANQGPEIQPAVAQRMFEPFYTTKKSGTGLGLAFASKIVELMEGRIWYARENDQNIFHVRLPRADS